MAKDPNNCKDREVKKHEQVPVDIEMNENKLAQPTMVSVNTTTDEYLGKQRAKKRKLLEKQLSKNTVKMNKIKKSNIKLKI